MLFVNTDVHGNLEDFLRMEAIWRAEPDARWVILGDVVHAPDDEARREKPELYDYDDGSLAIVERILDLQGTGRVHFVLGNHDHAHVGGKPTRWKHSAPCQNAGSCAPSSSSSKCDSSKTTLPCPTTRQRPGHD